MLQRLSFVSCYFVVAPGDHHEAPGQRAVKTHYFVAVPGDHHMVPGQQAVKSVC